MSESASDHVETEKVFMPPRKKLMRTIGLVGFSRVGPGPRYGITESAQRVFGGIGG